MLTPQNTGTRDSNKEGVQQMLYEEGDSELSLMPLHLETLSCHPHSWEKARLGLSS